jgi:hypothetical protein
VSTLFIIIIYTRGEIGEGSPKSSAVHTGSRAGQNEGREIKIK